MNMEHKIKKWKLLESEYIIRRPWLTAVVKKCSYPTAPYTPNITYSNIPTG